MSNLPTDNNQNCNLISNEVNQNKEKSLNYKEEAKNTIAIMFNNLQKKEKDDNELFESRIIDNEEEIKSIESKISTELFSEDNFKRENIASFRNYQIPKKIIKDEILILKEAQKEQESKIRETEEALQKEQEAKETKVQEQLNKVNDYYNFYKNKQNKKISTLSKRRKILISSIIVFFLILFIILLFFVFSIKKTA